MANESASRATEVASKYMEPNTNEAVTKLYIQRLMLQVFNRFVELKYFASGNLEIAPC